MMNYVGQQFGKYRLLRKIGTGGYAELFLGEHIHLSSQAAIKILHPQLRLEEDDIEAFRREARTIASLHHKNIVRILDFDIAEGIPFLVMEYAPNGTLRQRHQKGSRVPSLTVLQYVRDISAALQYTHDRGLIHRDVKPSNMLISENNTILLSDFGIATISRSPASQSRREMVGTAPYTAPEQLLGHPCAASDQYSLAVVIYEWLCGERPFQGIGLSIAYQQVHSPPLPLHEINVDIPLAVEEVVLKALAKDPAQRFESVTAFAAALGRAYGVRSYLSPTSTLIMSPVLHEDKFPASYVTAPAAALSAKEEQQVSDFETPSLPDPAPFPLPANAGELSAPPMRPAPDPPLAPKRRGQFISRRTALYFLGGSAIVLVVVTGAWVADDLLMKGHTNAKTSGSPPGPEKIPAIGVPIEIFRGHTKEVKASAWSPDGKRIASGSQDQTVQLWDAMTGKHVIVCHGHTAEVKSVAWSPDEKYVASGSTDETVRIWDAVTGELLRTYTGFLAEARAVAWSPDGKFLAAGTGMGTSHVDDAVRIWNITSNSTVPLVYKGHKGQVINIAWSPDGAKIASASLDGTVQVWDIHTGNHFSYTGHHASVRGVAWSHDGSRIASGGNDRTVQVWSASDGQPISTYRGHIKEVQSVAWSHDDKYISSGSFDMTVKIWEVFSGQNTFTYTRHQGQVWSVPWSPNAYYIASASLDKTVQVWRAV